MTVAALIFMGLCASAASCLLKKSTSGCKKVTDILKQPFFYAGGLLYVLSALLNIYLLRKLPYSVVVPLGSLSYVWTLFISSRFLGERMTRGKVAAIICILAGVWLLTLG